jgi:hypothetical protein
MMENFDPKDRDGSSEREFADAAFWEQFKQSRASGFDAKIVVDPTRPLNEQVGRKFPIDRADIERMAAKFESHRMVVVVGAHDGVIYSALHALVERLSKWRPLELPFHEGASADEPVTISTLLDPRIGDDGTPGDQQPTLIVTQPIVGASEFLNTLPGNPSRLAHVNASLGKDRRVAIFLNFAQMRRVQSKTGLSDCKVFIDVVRPLVRGFLPDASDELIERVRRQINDRRWGVDDEEGAIAVEAALNRNLDLETELARREASAGRAVEPEPTLPPSGWPDSKPLQLAVLFTATFLSELTVDDFDLVLTALVREDLEPAAPTPAVPAGSAPPPRRPLIELWQSGPRAILSECGLCVRNTTKKTIAFARDSVATGVRAEFEGGAIFEYAAFCRRLDSSRLFFHRRRLIGEAVQNLVVDRIKADPDGFGSRFFEALLASPHTRGRNDAPTDGAPVEIDENEWPFQRARIGSVLIALISVRLDTVVIRYLKSLLQAGFHSDVIYFVNRLRLMLSVEARFELLRRVLDEGGDGARTYAATTVLVWLSEAGTDAIDIYRAVRKWEDGGSAPHAAFPDALRAELVVAGHARTSATERNPLERLIGPIDAECAAEILAWVGQVRWHADEERPLDAIRGLLLRTFLWTLEDTEVSTSDTAAIATAQIIERAWIPTFTDMVTSLREHRDTDPFAQTFAALAIADCLLAATTAAESNSGAPDAWAILSRALSMIPDDWASGLRDNWYAFDAGLTSCLAAIALDSTTETSHVAFVDQLRARWTRIHTVLARLTRLPPSARTIS